MAEKHAAAYHNGSPTDPDCQVGKHRACIGSTFDERTDSSVDCSCFCHLVEF